MVENRHVINNSNSFEIYFVYPSRNNLLLNAFDSFSGNENYHKIQRNSVQNTTKYKTTLHNKSYLCTIVPFKAPESA